MACSQLPLVTPGLAIAAALPSDDDAGPLCRICFGPDESEDSGNISDQLISPCKCSGSIGYVHCSCLYAWRQQRCAEQGFRRSQQCEMCHAQYRIPRPHQHLFPRELFGGALPGPRHCLHMLAAKLRSPSLAAEFALDLWLHAMVLNGFHDGAQLACSNFNRTLALGLAIIQKNSQGLALLHGAPRANRLGLLALGQRRQAGPLAPLVHLPRAVGSTAFLAALTLEVLVLSGVSAYVGLAAGFCLGSWGMVRATAGVANRVLGPVLRRSRLLLDLPL